MMVAFIYIVGEDLKNLLNCFQFISLQSVSDRFVLYFDFFLA